MELTAQISASYPGCLPALTFEAICVKRGLLLKGGAPDRLRGAVMLLDEYRSGKLGRMTFDLPFELFKEESDGS